MIKRLIAFILCLTIMMGLTSCYESVEIDEYAYTVAVGLDEGEGNTVRVTLQFALPNNISGEGVESGGNEAEEGSPALKNVTLEATTISLAIELANDLLSKKVTISHAIILILGKDFVEKSFERFWNEIFVGSGFSPGIYVAVCDGKADEFIEKIIPVFETNPTQYIERMVNMSSSVYTINTDLYHVSRLVDSQLGDPGTILCSLVESEDNLEEGEISPEEVLNEQFSPEKVPKKGGPETVFLGIAVFSGKKLSGFLNARESWMYMASIGTRKLKDTFIEDPNDPDKYIAANMEQLKSPSIEVDVSGAVPKINVKLLFHASIYSIQNEDTVKSVNYEQVEKLMEESLLKDFEDFYYKLAREYNSDLISFGKYARKNFLTIDKWDEYAWREKYCDSSFNVVVEVKAKRSNMILFE